MYIAVKCFKLRLTDLFKIIFNYAPLHDDNVFEFTGVLLFFWVENSLRVVRGEGAATRRLSEE